jgi:hypothetical protein
VAPPGLDEPPPELFELEPQAAIPTVATIARAITLMRLLTLSPSLVARSLGVPAAQGVNDL